MTKLRSYGMSTEAQIRLTSKVMFFLLWDPLLPRLSIKIWDWNKHPYISKFNFCPVVEAMYFISPISCDNLNIPKSPKQRVFPQVWSFILYKSQ